VTAIDVRRCTSQEELRQGLAPIWHFFGATPTGERLERFSAVLPPERMFAAWVDGAVAGGAGAFPFELTIPGGRVRAAGITLVGVFPTHRRRGILRAMMRAQLDQVHEDGEPVAYLWASEETIYGRFGYGIASLSGSFDLPRDRATFVQPFEPTGQVRLVESGEEALDLMAPVYEAVAAETPGMFARTREWWSSRVLADPEWRRGGGGELQRAVLDVDGRPQAYALYRLHMSFESGVPTGSTNVIEAMGTTPEATREIWRFLLDIDWMRSIKAGLLPVDHPLFFLLAEPRRMGFRVLDGLWVRLVDVEAALAARSYGDGSPLTIEVVDAFCPWNEGRFRVPGGERTNAAPDLRVDVTTLGSVYLGGFTFAELARALRLEELSPGAIARADTLFRADRAPWCPEIF
jgi:predicted acetyltransferase